MAAVNIPAPVQGDGSLGHSLACSIEGAIWKDGQRRVDRSLSEGDNRLISALVVTYNPDIERLEENLSAISAQVDFILVFDNASENVRSIEPVLSKMANYYCLCPQNAGLAKALNAACGASVELGCSYVLLLDQDSIAGKNMVAGLLEQQQGEVALASPQIVDRNKREGFVSGGSSETVKRAITSGALVSLSAWQNVGGFDERLFVDWVDYEFSANLRAHGYRIVRDNRVMLLHEMGRREYAFRLPIPGGGRSFYRSNHALSRQRDKARSWAIVKQKYGWSKIGREERAFIAAIKARDLALERNRLAIFKAFLQGAKEGRSVARR